MGERPVDEVWDKLVELFGDVTNSNSRAARNKAVKLLKESGATPDELERRYNADIPAYMKATPNAFVKYWDDIGQKIGDPPVYEGKASGESSIESTFSALWPGRKFEKSGWNEIIGDLPVEKVKETLQDMAYYSKFAPGAADVRAAVINSLVGAEAPPEPQAALIQAKTRIQDVNAGLEAAPLHDLVIAALRVTVPFDDSTFLSNYSRELGNFYRNYGST